MKYRIVEYDKQYWPQYKQFLRWRPLLDLMNTAARFYTRGGAMTFIYRMHCNWLNNTAQRRIKWGRTTEPNIKD